MKRTKLVILSFLVSVGLVVGVASATQAKWSENIQSHDKVNVAAGQTHQGSLYATGDQIVIEGTVDGDLYCAGRELVISGEVTGDVLCATQSATIDGRIGQDLRLAGQYANLSGGVAGSVTFFGQDIKLLAGSSVGGDLNGAAQHAALSGPVERSVLIGVERLTLQSTVGGNVDVGASRVTLGNDAGVVGDLNYASDKKLDIDQSKVAGEISFNQTESSRQQDNKHLGWLLLVLLGLILSALAIVSIAPRFVERSRAILTRDYLRVVLVGFTALIGTPILAAFVMATIVLAPISLLMMTLWLAAILVSNFLFAYLLGSLLFASQRNVLVRMVAGITILFVLYLIPVLNALVGFAALVVGIGMAVSTVFDGYRRPSFTLTAQSKKKR